MARPVEVGAELTVARSDGVIANDIHYQYGRAHDRHPSSGDSVVAKAACAVCLRSPRRNGLEFQHEQQACPELQNRRRSSRSSAIDAAMNNYSAPFVSDGLDEMRRGTIELSVPLRNDVIQVAARGDSDTQIGRIRVSKRRRTVTVMRVDGKPMQVDITTDARLSTPEGVKHTTTKARVFHEPVRELRFRRTHDRAGQECWCAEVEYVNIARQQNMKQFADTIGTFALAKQSAGVDHRSRPT